MVLDPVLGPEGFLLWRGSFLLRTFELSYPVSYGHNPRYVSSSGVVIRLHNTCDANYSVAFP